MMGSRSNQSHGLFLPGSMYSHFLRLGDGRLLLSWSKRSANYHQDGFGAGTRALLSYDDGDTFQPTHDYIVYPQLWPLTFSRLVETFKSSVLKVLFCMQFHFPGVDSSMHI